MCGHHLIHHNLRLGECEECFGGRCTPEPEYHGTAWEGMEVAARKKDFSPPMGSEVYMVWLMIKMARAVSSGESDRRTFEQYMKSHQAAWNILRTRGLVETKPGLSPGEMLVGMAETFADMLKEWEGEYPAEVSDAVKVIQGKLRMFPVAFKSASSNYNPGTLDWGPEDDYEYDPE